jgi:hypothetical protein
MQKFNNPRYSCKALMYQGRGAGAEQGRNVDVYMSLSRPHTH